MATISASTARQTLPAQLDRVQGGEEVEITRHGQVVAVLVSPEVLRRHRARQAWNRADDLAVRLERAREEAIHAPVLSAERAEELVSGVRAEREAR